jgi:hypothetical protein
MGLSAPNRRFAASAARALLLSFGCSRIMKAVGIQPYPPELNLAAVASRSSLFGALLRSANPVDRQTMNDFLRGLSRDELECLAEFQGACVLEQVYSTSCHPYRLMADFFNPSACERWHNSDDRAHKMYIVLGYLDRIQATVSVRVGTASRNPHDRAASV